MIGWAELLTQAHYYAYLIGLPNLSVRGSCDIRANDGTQHTTEFLIRSWGLSTSQLTNH